LHIKATKGKTARFLRNFTKGSHLVALFPETCVVCHHFEKNKFEVLPLCVVSTTYMVLEVHFR